MSDAIPAPPPLPALPTTALAPAGPWLAGDAPAAARRNADVTRLWALIPCAGSGLRAAVGRPGAPTASAVPKQYQSVAGKPMVLHTLAAFAAVPRLAGTLVVVPPGDRFFLDHPAGLQLPGVQVADCGGATRAASVANGLAALAGRGAAPADWVLVHDAARCLVTAAQVNALIDACLADAVGGLLALPLADTLKRAAGGRVAETLDRGDKWLAQTPQMFRLAALADALAHAGPLVTDEASAMESVGHAPRLVPGSAHNFKVTVADDFALAEAVLLGRLASATTERYQGRRDDVSSAQRPGLY